MNALSRSFCAFWHSSIGKKLVVAITGIMMVLFLAGHLSGNLLIFVGPVAFDEYAEFLHSFLHGYGVWGARIGLLVALVLHVVATIQLTRQNRAAQDVKYAHESTVQASRSSRLMIWSGMTILAFIVFHILHYTVKIDQNLAQLADDGQVYAMVIKGFQNVPASLFYIIAITLLCSHLSHGVGSIFQTLGLRSKKSAGLIDFISKAYALVIWLGFISIPIAILVFGLGSDYLKSLSF